MNDVLAFSVVIAGCFLWWITSRHVGALSPASFYIGFMVVDLAFFELICFLGLDSSDIKFTAMPWPDFEPVFAKTVLVYGGLIVAGAVSVVGLRRNGRQDNEAKGSFPAARNAWRPLLPFFLGFSILVFLAEILHIIEIDWDVFWKNDQYLLLNSPVLAGVETLHGRLIHFALRPIGLLMVASATFHYLQRRRGLAIWLMLLSVYPFLLALAQNSRWAPVYIAGIVAILLSFGRKRKHFIYAAAWGGVVFLLMIKVLVGRNTPYQGLGNFWEVISVVFANMNQLGFWVAGVFMNVFQGAQNFANSLLLAPYFPVQYKLVSLMPTISAIDHFDTIKEVCLVKITPFVPMNAYSETFLFGPGYFAFFIFVVMLWLRVVSKLFIDKSGLGVAISVFACWIILGLSQYPVRNYFRFLILSLLIGWIAIRGKRVFYENN